jgi:hypothetical protein
LEIHLEKGSSEGQAFGSRSSVSWFIINHLVEMEDVLNIEKPIRGSWSGELGRK